MVELPDYIIAELGTDELPEFEPTDTEHIELPVPVSESITPVVVDRYPINVDGTSFSASRDRLYLMSTTGDKTVEKFVSSLIVVVAEARDSASSSWGKVVRFYDRDGMKKELYLRNSDIATNGRAIIKILVDEGLQVSTDSRMIDALQHYLNMAPPLEKEMATCTDRIGWHGEIYLLPDNSVIGNADTRVVYTGAPIGNHHATKGTLPQWKDNVAALCRGNTMLIFAICISLAAVLLRLLKVESGGYHIFGESSTGKSTTLYVGASVHSEPNEFIGTWRSTSNGVEARAKQCNDSLMINDELHQSTAREAGGISYLIMNDKGKQRANVLGGARDVNGWRLNCLSSGEVAYAAFIQEGGKNSRAGQEVRMVDISADMGAGLGVFENIHVAKDSHTFAEQIKKACLNYYGTPIRAFLEELVGNIDRLEPCFDSTKENFFNDYVPVEASGQVKRVATKFAVAALAGELATEMGITGWDEGEAYEAVGSCFTRWLSNRGTTGQQEAEKAVEQIKNFLLRHGMSRFIPVNKNSKNHFEMFFSDRQYVNMAGYRYTNADHNFEFIVSPDAFKNEMCAGLNIQYVAQTLADRSYIEVDSTGKPQVPLRMPGMPQSRYYHFKSTIFDEADEFVAEEPETAE